MSSQPLKQGGLEPFNPVDRSPFMSPSGFMPVYSDVIVTLPSKLHFLSSNIALEELLDAAIYFSISVPLRSVISRGPAAHSLDQAGQDTPPWLC